MKLTLITNGDALNKHIVKINKDAGSLADAVQVALASAAFFALKDGNVSTLNALFVAAGKGMRKTAMAQWALKFAPVLPNDDKEKAKEAPFVFSKDKLSSMLDETATRAEQAETLATTALAIHWTDYKEPPLVPENWSLTDAIKKLVAQAKSLEGKGTKVAGMAVLADLQALIGGKAEEPAGT